MTDLAVPLVGANFRPPAKQLLAALPSGQPLCFEAEPTNPYDPKAIQVLVATATIPAVSWDALEHTIGGTGWTCEALKAIPLFHLGYVGDSDGRICQSRGWKGNRELSELVGPSGYYASLDARLAYTADGTPVIAINKPNTPPNPSKSPRELELQRELNQIQFPTQE